MIVKCAKPITRVGYFVLCSVLYLLAACGSVHSSEDAMKRPVYDLIERVIPGYSKQFILEVIPWEEGKDVFEIGNKNGKIHLKGNNGVSLASAFNWYLKYKCNAHLSWTGDQLDLPAKLPLPQVPYKNIIEAEYRVHFNYCTISYTAAWWDWERWEREIDFLAMNGVNTPLSVVGLEGVWYHTLLKSGFTDEEVREFLVGPAYFAWQWMTNIQSHGGPLPKSWIDRHIELGKKIMERQLELGMQPIQQGFSGYVPRAFKEKFPEAALKQETTWLGFKGTMQLDPLDPLFKKFGTTFLNTQKEIFGAHGLYAADPFHEGEPPQEGEEYLGKVGKAIISLMTDFDPEAKWAMQAWSIRKDIASAVPKDRLLILDLNGERYKQDNFWEYNFVAGNLHNFGGRINMHGDLQLLASNQFQKALQNTGTAVGSGLFMEAVNQNPVYYDLAFEMPFHKDEVDIRAWLKKAIERRYGAASENACQAWIKLLEGPYTRGTNGVENSSIICARPAIDVKKSGPNAGFHIPYDPGELQEALYLLTKDAGRLNSSEPYRFDLVDLARQVLSNLGQEIHKRAAKAFKDRDLAEFDQHSKAFLVLLEDVDKLLKTREEFSFGKWVADARSWGTNEQEKNLYEKNASMLVTIWGSDEDSHIFDYSWREWSGLIDSYYLPRWHKFYAMLRQHLVNDTVYVEEGLPQVYGREALRANKFYDELANWEIEWVESQKNIDPTPRGDEVTVVNTIIEKYRPIFNIYYYYQ